MPEHYEGEGCISMARPENPVAPEPKELVLYVFENKKDCVDQAVRFADGDDTLPMPIRLQLSDSVAEAYICRERPNELVE
jgi:hypothetical protein